jgi:hypothetical protein
MTQPKRTRAKVDPAEAAFERQQRLDQDRKANEADAADKLVDAATHLVHEHAYTRDQLLLVLVTRGVFS